MNMKKFFYLLLSATLFACCSQEDPGVVPDAPDRGEAKYHTVTFDLQGELADVGTEEEPLTKAGGDDDIYVVTVHSKDSTQSNYYGQYAYGVFDSKEGMSLKLKEGLLYRFEVTVIKNGKNNLYWTSDTTFYWGTSQNSKFRNRFTLGGWYNDHYDAYQAMMCYKSTDGSVGYHGCAPLDRYYGELTDYEPVEGGKVSVYLYRVVFAARVKVTGLISGRLEVSMSRCPRIVMTADSVYTHEGLYQMYYLGNMMDCVAKGEPLEELMSMTVKWYSGVGDEHLDIYNDNFTVTRLKRTTININLSQKAPVKSTGAVTFTEENINE